MLSGQDVWATICETLDLLENEGRECTKLGIAAAETERDYRMALAEKILRLREENMPVTICPDIARGCREVALKRFERDCAEARYKASMEAINIYKRELGILENEYKREWGR